MFQPVERLIILRTVEMFAGAPDWLLRNVAQLIEEKPFGAGDPIVEQGSLGTSMFIVATGSVHVVVDGKQVATLGERQVFGEFAAIDPEPRSATVIGAEAGVAFRLPRAVLMELLVEHPGIAQAIIGVLVRRLRSVQNKAS